MNSDQILYIKILCNYKLLMPKKTKMTLIFFSITRNPRLMRFSFARVSTILKNLDEYSKKVLVGFSMKNKIWIYYIGRHFNLSTKFLNNSLFLINIIEKGVCKFWVIHWITIIQKIRNNHWTRLSSTISQAFLSEQCSHVRVKRVRFEQLLPDTGSHWSR